MDPKENIDTGEIYAQKPYYDSGARVETSLRFKPSIRLDCSHRCQYKQHRDGGSRGYVCHYCTARSIASLNLSPPLSIRTCEPLHTHTTHLLQQF